MLLLFLFLIGQRVIELKTPHGQIQVNVTTDEKDISVKDVKMNIQSRLDKIEKILPEAGEKITNLRRKKIVKLLREIKDLLDYIPGEGVVSIGDTVNKPVLEPIGDEDFNKLIEQLNEDTFSDDMLRTLVAASSNYFLVDQVYKILDKFTMSSDRLKALSILWPRVLDKEKGFRLLQLFTFDSDKKEASRIIGED